MNTSRRRFFSVVSAACLMGTSARAQQWRGTALGAGAQVILDHPNADQIIQRSLAEIRRLEKVFSLYRSDSEITRLNVQGYLEAPSFELLDCLSIARRIHRATGARFDPTVQALWRVLAQVHSTKQGLSEVERAAAEKTIGFERVVFNSGAVSLSPGQQITLNGIAQGYIADRVALVMQAEGVEDTLINTGQLSPLGSAKGREGWPVKIAGEELERSYSNRAICTSAPLGTVLDTAGVVGHIIDPRKKSVVETNVQQVSVSAPRAGLADALSTALCLVRSKHEAEQLLQNFKEARLEGIRFDSV